MCFLLGSAPVTWPAGYAATKLTSGKYALLDAKGKQVAVSGNTVAVGGGMIGEAASYCGTEAAFSAFVLVSVS
ncbi:MAG: hypothetical protein QOH57_567 [Mycobacterium sp.]|nr:hypothetical protein [Mycobacterium sp.]